MLISIEKNDCLIKTKRDFIYCVGELLCELNEGVPTRNVGSKEMQGSASSSFSRSQAS